MKNLPKAHLTPKGLYEAKGVDRDSGRRKSFYAKSPAEASLKAARSLGQVEEPDHATLYGYYRTVYIATVQMRSANWLAQIFWAMDRHILPALGETPLAELKRPAIQGFFNSLGRTLKPKSIDNVRKVLSGVVKLALIDDAIAKDPMLGLRLAPTPVPEKTALTFAELGTLLAAAPDRIRPVILLTGFCGGLRVGEACAMTRSNMKNGELLIRQQALQLKGGCRIVQTLKTPQSRREIPLPAGLSAALLACNQVSHVFIASDSVGGYLLPKNATRELTAACKDAGIPHVSPHELRHTFISLMENELEAPPAIAAALAGKSDKRVTGGYSHTHRSQLLKWMQAYYDRALQEAEKAAEIGASRQA